MEIAAYIVGVVLFIGAVSFYMAYRRHRREQAEINRKAAEQAAYKAGRDAARPVAVNRTGSVRLHGYELQMRVVADGYYSLELVVGEKDNRRFVLIAKALLHGSYYLLPRGNNELLAIPQSVSPVNDPSPSTKAEGMPAAQKWPESLVHVLQLNGWPEGTLQLPSNLLVCHALLVRGGAYIAYLTRTGSPGTYLPTTGKAGGELQVWLAPVDTPDQLQPLYYDAAQLPEAHKGKLLEGGYLVEEGEGLVYRSWETDKKYRGRTVNVALYTTPRTASPLVASNAA